MDETPKRTVGRPMGPTDPDKLHADEITRWIRVNGRIRGLIERQLKYLEFTHNESETGDIGVNLEGMLDIMDGLGKLLTVSSRTVETGLKAMERGHKGPTDEEDISEILEGVSGGRGS